MPPSRYPGGAFRAWAGSGDRDSGIILADLPKPGRISASDSPEKTPAGDRDVEAVLGQPQQAVADESYFARPAFTLGGF
jgi:hypothetical protein